MSIKRFFVRSGSVVIRTIVRITILLFRFIFTVISFLIRLALDFLIENRCVLCKKSRRGEGRGNPDPAGMMKSITLPVRTRWLGISIENHPVCSHCAGLLDRAETVGMIGYILPDHSVITVQGEHIGAKGDLEDEKEGEDRAKTIPIHLISPWMTNDALLSIVHLMKYKSYDALASLMSSSIVTAFHTFSWPIPENSVLIPVPMHEKDRRERNRNHSEAICRRISIKLGLPVARTALKKVRRTRRQSQTARNARAKNVEGAFSANNVAGHHVFLVDDVVTSGTTSAACITALMSAGARSVSVLSFARSL